jgi:hypothetical protein
MGPGGGFSLALSALLAFSGFSFAPSSGGPGFCLATIEPSFKKICLRLLFFFLHAKGKDLPQTQLKTSQEI